MKRALLLLLASGCVRAPPATPDYQPRESSAPVFPWWQVDDGGGAPMPSVRDQLVRWALALDANAPDGTITFPVTLTQALTGTSATFSGAVTVLSLTTTAGSGTANITLPAGGRLFLDGTRYISGGTTIDMTGGVVQAPSGFTTANTYTSTVGSGSNALAISTAGARADLGPGANDYLYSDNGRVASASHLMIGSRPTLMVLNKANPQCLQYGEKALSGGVITITFGDEGGAAFGATPSCLCGDTSNTTETNCSTTAESTTQVTLNGTTTGTYTWSCVGDCP